MLITPGEKKDLKKTTKRLMIFLAIVFLLDAFISFLFFESKNVIQICTNLPK